jgi:hypothetical protein
MREEHQLRVFEKKVLMKTSGYKWDRASGVWRRPHNEEFYDQYSPYIIWVMKSRRMRWGVACGKYGGEERCIQGFCGEASKKNT